MRQILCCALLGGLMLLLASSEALPQPPTKGDKKGKDKAGKRFDLGTVIPPHIRQDLDLTAEQSRELAELEQLVRERLNKLLSPEQKRKFAEAGPPPKDKEGPMPKEKGKDGPPPKDGPTAQATQSIQWFATWEAATAEAKRTQRPILLVSAAPHCAGVSGIW